MSIHKPMSAIIGRNNIIRNNDKLRVDTLCYLTFDINIYFYLD